MLSEEEIKALKKIRKTIVSEIATFFCITLSLRLWNKVIQKSEKTTFLILSRNDLEPVGDIARMLTSKILEKNHKK